LNEANKEADIQTDRKRKFQNSFITLAPDSLAVNIVKIK
jgi:hypothetical protein